MCVKLLESKFHRIVQFLFAGDEAFCSYISLQMVRRAAYNDYQLSFFVLTVGWLIVLY
jgi:hypothetical protein